MDINEGNYFCNLKYVENNKAEKSTYYLQFTKAPFDLLNSIWSEDSIYIYGYTFVEIGLNKLFRYALPNFDFYDITSVSSDSWNELYAESRKMDIKVQKAMDELKIWVDECFKKQDTFIIIGI